MSSRTASPRATLPSNRAAAPGLGHLPAQRGPWLLALALLLAAPAAVADGPDATLTAAGWQELRFDDKTPNSYSALEDGGVRITTNASVSMLYRPETAASLAQTPMLRWRWRVLEAGPATDLTVKGADDRPAALYVSFPYDSARASFWERMRRPLVEMSQGADAPGKVLVYVWGGKQPRGTRFDSPYMGSASGNWVLRSGAAPTGTWFEEAVDLVADFEAAFGYAPPDPVQIAVSADSDDSAARSVAEITEIRFAARP